MDTKIYFCTNRRLRRLKPTPDFGDEHPSDIEDIRFGSASSKVNYAYKAELDKIIGKMEIYVARERLSRIDARQSRLGSDEIFSDIREQMLGGADALLFVHGYNFTFHEALARAIQLSQWLNEGRQRPLLVLLFTWPSRGAGVEPKTYTDDRNMAATSGPALGRAIQKAADFIRAIAHGQRCDGRIHILAHSMGNWALRHAIQNMRTFVGNNIPPLFDEVLLLAADEDSDALTQQHKLLPILRGSRRVTVYYNHQDLALKASDVAVGNPDRLGRSGPAVSKIDKVEMVNVSPAIILETSADAYWQRDPTGHQYYRNNPLVRDDLISVMDGRDAADISGRTAREGFWRLG